MTWPPTNTLLTADDIIHAGACVEGVREAHSRLQIDVTQIEAVDLLQLIDEGAEFIRENLCRSYRPR
jgi:hypothetical protein